MDALSDLLRVVRLSGGIFLDGEFSAPWCINSQVTPEDCQLIKADPGSVVAFHFVAEGRMQLMLDGSGPIEVAENTVVLLTRNDHHVLGSGPGLLPVTPEDHLEVDADSGIMRVRYGGGGERTRIVCGFVGSDLQHHPLVDALPPVLVLPMRDEPGCQWVATSFRYAAESLGALRPGAATALARLSELMFIEAVRSYVDARPEGERGWLGGLRDPVVGRALMLMHTRIEHPWTTSELARAVALSRSAFAERFTGLIGTPPMSYLGAWRMRVAAQRLRESQRSVAQVAAEVGYESEAAFTRAFAREIGVSPARWRREARQPGPEPALTR
ncbi:MAG: AraC family transcriptional regulator [Burkholderiaceae bacterium]|nr:AraC family transcriptional regulator [Burkholderiaceae bacterium]